MIKIQTFKTLLEKGVRIKQCKKIKMRTKVYMLTLRWRHMTNDITMDVLLVFQEYRISVSVDSLRGHYYYTELLRKEISEFIQDIQTDLSFLPDYRFHFLYNKMNVEVSPHYVIQDLKQYRRRMEDEAYVETEYKQLLEVVNQDIEQLTLPPHQPSDIFFRRIILYGYDGIQLSQKLEKEHIIKQSYTRSVTFPNAVCQFLWRGIDNPQHNREEELVKIWYRHLRNKRYSCEIIF